MENTHRQESVIRKESLNDGITQNDSDPQSPFRIEANSLPDTSRPHVEWVYPGGNNNIEVDIIDENIINEDTHIVDPNHIIIEPPLVDGKIVAYKYCSIKICGLVIFDDTFPCVINPKVCPVIALIIMTIFLVVINLKNTELDTSPNKYIYNQTNSHAPSMIIYNQANSHAPSMIPIDARRTNITNILFEVSGGDIFEDNSAQNRAMKWIIEEDQTNLKYNSPNLIQRYAMMVFHYSLLGEQWYNNDGFGSEESECDWSGVLCIHSNIYSIEMEDNNLVGNVPKEMGLFSGLHTLILRENSIRGTIPKEIGELRKIRILRLDDNMLVGSIPHEITDCRNLEKLSLKGNQLTGSIPPQISNLKSVIELKLYRNQLSGNIPSELSKLITLDLLWLNDNKLTGSIPTELALIKFLSTIHLSSNQLIGNIPSSFQGLINLNELSVFDNRLSGAIPSFIFSLSKLRKLDLSGNNFSGTIRESFTFMDITSINLSNNALNGTIPSTLETLNGLFSLQLHHNDLTGSVPNGICNLLLNVLTIDCYVSCSCCEKCF